MTHDLVVRGGTIVGAHGEAVGDLAVDEGRISELGSGLRGRRELDAHGLYVLPGATLTIQAGTVVASVPQVGGGGSLAVCRGAQIFVQGTQANPVIMTSTNDTATWTGGNPKTGTWREAANEWGNLTIMGTAYISESVPAGQNSQSPSPANFATMEGLTAAFPGDTRLFYGGGDAQSSPMIRKMRQLGMKSAFVTGEMSRSPTFLKVGGEAAEGAIVYMGGLPKEKMPGFAGYAARYKARFNEDVITYSPYSYDGTIALLTAMKNANSTDPKVYTPYLGKVSVKGVSAPSIAYDAKGDLKDAPVTIYKVEHGAFKPVDTIAGN